MSHSTKAPADLAGARNSAHAIRTRLAQLDVPLKLNHAYEALAAAWNHPNWATMKASLSSTPTQGKLIASEAARFMIGEDRNGDIVDMPSAKMVNHIHSYSLYHQARRRFLLCVSRNAVRNGSGLVFVEPIESESFRNEAAKALVEMASEAKRSRDVVILDLSQGSTRMGTGFNVVAEIETPAQFVGLLHPRLFNLPHLEEISKFAFAQALSAKSGGGRLRTADLHREIDRMCAGDAKLPLGEHWHKDGRVEKSSGDYLKREIEKLSSIYPKFFDEEASSGNLSDVLRDKKLVLVFVARDADAFESAAERIVFASLARAVAKAPAYDGRFPDMLVSNDVDGLVSRELSRSAKEHGVSLVVGDQCVTPPSFMGGNAVRFRIESNRLADSYLLDSNGDIEECFTHK